MDKMSALKYLVENDPSRDEWVMAGMFKAMKEIVKSDSINYSSKDLDELIKKAENF